VYTKHINKTYFFLIALIPLSIVLGSSISLLNILLLSLIFLIFNFSDKFNEIKNDKTILILFSIFIYLIFNSLISYDFKVGALRNLGFFRFIILFLVINFFFYISKKTEKIFIIWLLTIFVILIDSYIEFFTGKNLIGYGGIEEIYGDRIVSFFKDEAIVGAYLNGFIFIIIGYLFKEYFKKDTKIKLLLFLATLFFIVCIILTGERSNGVKAIIGIGLFFLLNKNFNFKFKFVLLITFLLISAFTISSSSFLKARYITAFYLQIADKQERAKFLEHSIYVKLYKSGIAVFQDNPLFGVGNKNYRVVTCLPNDEKKEGITKNYYCGTHPHQIYLELLSEHGFVGTVILLSLLFILIFKNLKIIILSRNSVQLGCFVYLIINFIPLLPSGSFFNDFNASLFWINMSLLYACDSKTNIFYKIRQ